MGSTGEVVGNGVSDGIGRGELQVDLDHALEAMDLGRAVVLALETSSPGDVAAMTRAAAVVTVRGTAHSHTAIVTRAVGVPAVVGVVGMTIDATGVQIDGQTVAVGSTMTVDGASGSVRWEHG